MRVHLTLVICSLLLAMGLALQFVVVQHYAYDTTAGRADNPLIRQTLLGEIAGWDQVDIPLGISKDEQMAIFRQLNYDDSFFRIYTKGQNSFAVYISYWGPNKMSASLVASHTPDRCWLGGGWICEQYDIWTTPKISNGLLQAAYWRRFKTDQGAVQEVLYWHLVGGRAQIYGGNVLNSIVDWRFWWKEALRFGISGNEDQYFIRITSASPLKELWQDPGFQEVMKRLARLGLKHTVP